jgi:hypothetical protein
MIEHVGQRKTEDILTIWRAAFFKGYKPGSKNVIGPQCYNSSAA